MWEQFMKTDGFRSGSATQALTLIRQAQFGRALSVQAGGAPKVEDEEDEAEHYQDADYDEDEDEEEDEVLPAEEEEDYQEIRGSVLLDVEMMKSANQAMKERLTIPPLPWSEPAEVGTNGPAASLATQGKHHTDGWQGTDGSDGRQPQAHPGVG